MSARNGPAMKVGRRRSLASRKGGETCIYNHVTQIHSRESHDVDAGHWLNHLHINPFLFYVLVITENA